MEDNKLYDTKNEELSEYWTKNNTDVSILKKYQEDGTKITFRMLNHQEYFFKGIIKEVYKIKSSVGIGNSMEGPDIIGAGFVLELENGEKAYFKSWEIDFETLHPSSYSPIRYFNRVPISEELKNKIFVRDNYECQLKMEGCLTKATEIDHIIPVSKGGLNNEGNLQASCSQCNKKKNSNLIF